MANHRTGNVIFVDTTGTDLFDTRRISDIKYIGAAVGTAIVRADGVAGKDMWEASGDVEVFDQVRLRNSKGFHVILAGGASVYLYLGTE